MTISAGTRLGLYEITTLLGVGGMGEVYGARDTKLGRAVAIKVLPEALAFDPERVARFEREAKVLASLNHPHIAALHGMEQSAGQHFLIMELVEGETLAERLRRGTLPVEEALRLAIAITPDGSRVVYVGGSGNQPFMRPLDALDAVPIFNGAPRGPFLSPDGQWVGFVDGASNTLKKVAISGGPALTITNLEAGKRGATWMEDDTIVFATVATGTGLQRVSAEGGTPTVLTRPDRGRSRTTRGRSSRSSRRASRHGRRTRLCRSHF